MTPRSHFLALRQMGFGLRAITHSFAFPDS
jgi:hypothetical protein